MSAKLKQKSAHALLLVFILASILFLKPDATIDHDTGFVSSELEVRKIVERNVTSTSYVNSNGIITAAGQPVTQAVVVMVPLAELHPFPEHPFQVRDDESMRETAASVKENGVIMGM